jgi:hypothetical protein
MNNRPPADLEIEVGKMMTITGWPGFIEQHYPLRYACLLIMMKENVFRIAMKPPLQAKYHQPQTPAGKSKFRHFYPQMQSTRG